LGYAGNTQCAPNTFANKSYRAAYQMMLSSGLTYHGHNNGESRYFDCVHILASERVSSNLLFPNKGGKQNENAD